MRKTSWPVGFSNWSVNRSAKRRLFRRKRLKSFSHFLCKKNYEWLNREKQICVWVENWVSLKGFADKERWPHFFPGVDVKNILRFYLADIGSITNQNSNWNFIETNSSQFYHNTRKEHCAVVQFSAFILLPRFKNPDNVKKLFCKLSPEVAFLLRFVPTFTLVITQAKVFNQFRFF